MRTTADKETYYLVIARDSDWDGTVRCVRCREPADDVHEIMPRSSSFPGLFNMDNRCCLCRKCHREVQSDIGRGQLFHILSEKYDYEYVGKRKCLLEDWEIG